MKQQLKSKKGSALITVLIFLLVMSVLGTAAIAVSITETNLTEAQEHKVQARYLAQSGAQAVAEYMISNPDSSAADLLGTTSNKESPISDGDFQVTVSERDAQGKVIISSKGTYKGISQQASIALSTTSDNGFGGLYDYTVAALDGFSVGGNLNGSDFSPKYLAALDISLIDNDVLQDLKTEGISLEAGTLKEDPDLDELIVPIMEANIPQSAVEKNFNGISQTLTVNNGEVKHYKTTSNGISYTGNSGIKVTGTGIVHLYVLGGASFGGNSTVQVDETAGLIVYFIGSSNVVWSGSTLSSGPVLLYAPEAKVSFKNAQISFVGAIYAQSVKFHNKLTISYNENARNILYNKLNNDFVSLPHAGITFSNFEWIG